MSSEEHRLTWFGVKFPDSPEIPKDYQGKISYVQHDIKLDRYEIVVGPEPASYWKEYLNK